MSRSNDIANITASVLDGVTASEVGLGNVTNESKATMFTSPTFTGDVSATNIKHASSSSNNLVLASDGNVSITNEITSGTFNGTIGASATFASALFNKGNNGYVILPSGIEIKWGNTSTISSFAGSASHTHTYTSDQGGAFGTATLWGIVWIADRTQGVVANGGVTGSIYVDDSASSITFYGNTNAGSTGSNIRYLFLAIGH